MPITSSGLVYDTHGTSDQQSIVFVHGGAQVRQCWDHQFFDPLFDEDFLVRFDLSQHGESRDVDDFSLLTLGQDIQEIIQTLHLVRPVLTGWSIGGLAICSWIEQYGSQNLGGLIFVDAFVDADTTEVSKFMDQDVLTKVLGFTSTDTQTYQQAIQFFVDALTARRRNDNERYMVLGQICTARLTKLVDVLLPTPFHGPTLEKARGIPILLVHGTMDRLISVEYSRRTAHLHGTQYHEFERSGHSPHIEEHKAFNEVVHSFIEAYVHSRTKTITVAQEKTNA